MGTFLYTCLAFAAKWAITYTPSLSLPSGDLCTHMSSLCCKVGHLIHNTIIISAIWGRQRKWRISPLFTNIHSYAIFWICYKKCSDQPFWLDLKNIEWSVLSKSDVQYEKRSEMWLTLPNILSSESRKWENVSIYPKSLMDMDVWTVDLIFITWWFLMIFKKNWGKQVMWVSKK